REPGAERRVEGLERHGAILGRGGRVRVEGDAFVRAGWLEAWSRPEPRGERPWAMPKSGEMRKDRGRVRAAERRVGRTVGRRRLRRVPKGSRSRSRRSAGENL